MAAHGNKAGGVQHLENVGVDHEAVLAGVMALANLFSNCVEAFNLIHPAHRWDRDEQLLLCRLGLQQARLLVWGDVVGISSPPASVTDRAVPKHPSSVYPDLSEPTFFGARNPLLEEHETRTAIEAALSAIIDRSTSATREEMMDKYGLKPPKRLTASIYQAALDTNRLEAFREHFELLKEVAESYAHLQTSRRNASVVQTSWWIANQSRFGAFIALTKEKVDFLIDLLGAGERVDRAIRMDIKAIGWHLTNDRGRIASDRATLRLVHEVCRDDYPQYLPAVLTALTNIESEWREINPNFNPYTATSMAAPPRPPRTQPAASTEATNGNSATNNGAKPVSAAASARQPEQQKHSGLFGSIFKGFRQKDKEKSRPALRQRSSSYSKDDSAVPARSNSESGPFRDGNPDLFGADLAPVRSKSVGALQPDSDDDDEDENDAVTPLARTTSRTATAVEGDGIAPHEQSSFPFPAESSATADASQPGAQEPDKLASSFASLSAGDEEQPALERSDTVDTVVHPLEGTSPVTSMISRHDMYHGLGKQGTKGQ